MQLNPRARDLNLAAVTLRLSIHKIAEKYELTTDELMLILTETTYKVFNNLVRAEHQSEE